ncbi:MAG TPA: DUF4157 domain-containing protein, partial [Chloroflexota bacterium]|nr:DUF4157 domain-containing protein [Chloroflexota bacterium]
GQADIGSGIGAIGRAFRRWTMSRQLPMITARTRRSSARLGSPPVAQLSPSQVQMIARAGNAGVPLSDEHRVRMETVVGGPLQRARIHTGPAASETAAALGADAFAIGSDVFFGHGRFDPHTSRGRALLAHELVHVRQQTTLGGSRISEYGGTDDEAEAEARTIEESVLGAGLVTVGGGLSIGHLVRNYQADDDRDLSSEETARLDGISIQAVEVCRQLLGDELSIPYSDAIDSVTVDLDLNLTALSDEQAAEAWGEALARQIRISLATAPP